MTLIDLQKTLQSEFGDYFFIDTVTEMNRRWPEQAEDWGGDDDNYLVVGDRDDRDEVLSGAYGIEMGLCNFKMLWLPYPSDPIYGIDDIRKHLRLQILYYNQANNDTN